MERFHYELTNFKSEALTSEARLSTGFFLCVLHADKIPPHLGMISNGLFYSLKANGKDDGVPISLVLQIIYKRKIASLFFELSQHLIHGINVADFFDDFPAKIGENQTCLTPIKTLVKAPDSAEHIGDLMKYLEQSKHVLARITLHLPNGFSGIPYYTISDITKRIESLKHDKGQKSISQTNGTI